MRAFATLCTAPYERTPRFYTPLDKGLERLASVAAVAPTMTPPPKAQPDREQTRASLSNAWGTELLLAFGGEVARDDELVRLMNNWAVVQGYYVAYHAAQALIVALGQPRPQSHPKTQSQFADLWSSREVQLAPWSFAACADGWTNAPREIEDVNPWSGCDSRSCWDLAAKAMQTTRKEKLRESEHRARERKKKAARSAWEAEEAERLAKGRRPRKSQTFPLPRLKASEKMAADRKLRAYTVLDYLFRLRLKVNYDDATMFVEGPEDEDSSLRVHFDLVRLASSTLLVHELRIGAAIGKGQLLSWADEWLSKNSAGGSIGLGLRRDLLAAHLG